MFQFTDKPYLNVLIVIVGVMVIRYFGSVYFPPLENTKPKKNKKQKMKEGFQQQTEPFVLKQDQQIYDPFYAEVYDEIHLTDDRSKKEIEQIILLSQPSQEHSYFLDTNAKTGALVNNIQNKGFHITGIDSSEAMAEFAEKKHSQISVKCLNSNDAMIFDRGTFTHVLCLDYGIYHYDSKHKLQYLKNVYHWLSPGGYLFLHLIDPKQFNTIIPVGNPLNIDSPQKYTKSRITETVAHMPEYEYKGKYDFSNMHLTDMHLIKTETFKDKQTNYIRQNEQTLHIESKETILSVAQQIGFLLHGQINYEKINGDSYQYMIVLERPMTI